ncbi:uncharacterized protein LOC127290025 isoform X2 [Leptopilina boulardi]|uniref:uncharacterized protein LOC127290025 isoform X2 n=1 Tax=Leptopilina boulardi TaxID=63433 RepID=UPI0021F51165|nr:uncharacterized protein LOC127290025 isoform X2 [Leptopilina boulardi]XP_051174346.1 uncharacterized protein LOC127290025 isoform X2 [Leptopilina boulardi]
MTLPCLPLDIAVPPGVLSRRGAVTLATIFEKRTAEITVDNSDQNAVYIRISEAETVAASDASPTTPSIEKSTQDETDSIFRRLSNESRSLLENLNVSKDRPRHAGRFLTMHKRRRKRLITKSLNQDSGILDDIFHGQVACVLQRAGNWRFNAFTLETVTGGRSLPVLCVHLFHWYGLFQHFNLDVVRVWKLFSLIEEGYHSTNPYHNSIHATDVTQAMHCFLQEEKIKAHLSDLEIMASLIAAVTHDLDHPGVNQPFLVATSNHLAALYENTSVLENHHWRSAIGCLLESGVLEQLPNEIRPELQQHISSLILATDITRQQEFLTRFKNYLDGNLLDMKRGEDRHFILQIALKCADISNPCRPWDISRKWSYKVCEEFFRQGDYERQLNLPVTPLCDRQSTSIPKIQVGFFKFVVAPLYEEWHRFLGDGLSDSLMNYLRGNQKRWETMIQQENAEEVRTEVSELEEEREISSEEETALDDDSGSIDFALGSSAAIVGHQQLSSIIRRPSLPIKTELQRAGRRHSVPISCVKSLIPTVRVNVRRESLPNDNNNVKLKNPHLLLKHDDQSARTGRSSNLSLFSSKSSLLGNNSSGNSNNAERPVSAENLLPEPSIASITNSTEASRLSSVLQPDNHPRPQQKQLTRQQTFPPLQPYVRMRYMSTTAEMSQCCEILMEADSPSSSSPSPTKEKANDDDDDNKVSKTVDKLENDGKEVKEEEEEIEEVINIKIIETCTDGQCGTPLNEVVESKDDNDDDDDNDCCPKMSEIDDNFISNIESRRRASAVFETHTKTNVDYQRRHSMQILRTDDTTNNRHRSNRRPSSAQDLNPTQMLYASTAGSRTQIMSDISDLQRPDSRSAQDTKSSCEISISEDMRTFSTSTKSERYGVLQDARIKWVESEPRRYSTPVAESSSGKKPLANCGGRRFTAIPVTTEIGVSHKVFFIGSPPDSPPRVKSVSSSTSDSGSGSGGGGGGGGGGSDPQRRSIGGSSSDSVSIGSKRDSDTTRDKSMTNKIPKLSLDSQMKENVDPREETSSKSHGRRSSQGLSRRRGSAPVGLMSRLDDISTSSVSAIGEQYSRRGSVPMDISWQQNGSTNRSALGPREGNLPPPRRASLPQETSLGNLLGHFIPNSEERENCSMNNNNNNNNNNNSSSNNNIGNRLNEGNIGVGGGLLLVPGMPSPRRGSVPADISELRRDLFGRNSVNGKSRNRKKVLRRRSSGGPEMFAGGGGVGVGVGDNENIWLNKSRRDSIKRDSIPEPNVVKRRGSLPIDVVAVSHVGSAAGLRRSSLWRL